MILIQRLVVDIERGSLLFGQVQKVAVEIEIRRHAAVGLGADADLPQIGGIGVLASQLLGIIGDLLVHGLLLLVGQLHAVGFRPLLNKQIEFGLIQRLPHDVLLRRDPVGIDVVPVQISLLVHRAGVLRHRAGILEPVEVELCAHLPPVHRQYDLLGIQPRQRVGQAFRVHGSAAGGHRQQAEAHSRSSQQFLHGVSPS